MPFVTLSVFKGVRSSEEHLELCRAIQGAVKTALRIEHDNFHHRIHAYGREEMSVPAICSERYTAVEITFMSRRGPEDKKVLFALVQQVLRDRGVEERDTMIVLSDPPLENWYIRGRTGTEIAGSDAAP